MATGRKKLVTGAIPVVIEVAAGTVITENVERIDLPEAVVGAVSIQESVTTMTVDTVMRIAADHVVTVDAERSIRSVVTEAAVKAAVTTTTTIPTRIDAGPEAEMKGAIENLLDTAITRELCSRQRFLS